MHISSEEIAAYKKIHFKVFGRHINNEVAVAESIALLRLAEEITLPSGALKKDKYNGANNTRRNGGNTKKA